MSTGSRLRRAARFVAHHTRRVDEKRYRHSRTRCIALDDGRDVVDARSCTETADGRVGTAPPCFDPNRPRPAAPGVGESFGGAHLSLWMTATLSTPRSAPRPALFAVDTQSITSNQPGSRQARPRPSAAHESYGGARSRPGTRRPDARSGAGARRHCVTQAARLGKHNSRSVYRCSRRQRVMRAARHGGFADVSARGSSCRGASAQHAGTSALTQPIAKPPRRILLAGLLWRAVNLASAAAALVATARRAQDRAGALLPCVFREITRALPREHAG